jgi:serine protease Do
MKIMSGAAGVCAAAVMASLAWAPGAQAQSAPPRAPARRSAPFVFEQPGSVLGVSVRDAAAADVAKAKLPQAEGAVIQRVSPGSAAEHAGLQAGDVVVEFDGERVRSARQFSRLVQDTPPGRTVKAVVVREGARRTLDVTPDAPKRAAIEMPDLSGIQQKLNNLRFELPDIDVGPDSSRRRLGTALTPLTGQLADYFGVKRGVLVSSVDVNSPAARAGLKAGDIITAINGQEVDTPSDVRRELRESGTGGKIDLRIMRDKKELTLSATN